MFTSHVPNDTVLTDKSPFAFGSPNRSPPSPSSVADDPVSIVPIKVALSPTEAGKSNNEEDPFSAVNVDDMIVVWPTSGG